MMFECFDLLFQVLDLGMIHSLTHLITMSPWNQLIVENHRVFKFLILIRVLEAIYHRLTHYIRKNGMMGLVVIQILDKVSPIEVTNQFYKLDEVLVSGYLFE